MESPSHEAFGLFDLVKRLAEASVVLGAGLFLTGWSYLYGYYSGFGLTADDLGFSVDRVVIHSMPVLLRPCFLVTVVLAAVLLWVLYRFRATAALRNPAFVFVLIIALALVLSKCAVVTGRSNAHRDAFESTSNLPYVTLEGTATDPLVTGCSLDEANYRL